MGGVRVGNVAERQRETERDEGVAAAPGGFGARPVVVETVVAQQQLEAGGFTVALEVSDEATLDENLEDDERWDMTTNAIVFRPDPVLIAPFASCSWDGGWCTDEATVATLQTESDFEARYAALEELQRLWYEQAPMVKLVNNYGVAALNSRVQGLLGRMHFELEPEFTNCWIEE